jgi:uncharacterized membrane protein YhaH (DUF805 family)
LKDVASNAPILAHTNCSTRLPTLLWTLHAHPAAALLAVVAVIYISKKVDKNEAVFILQFFLCISWMLIYFYNESDSILTAVQAVSYQFQVYANTGTVIFK